MPNSGKHVFNDEFWFSKGIIYKTILESYKCD